jgi:hypothetical protein
VTITEVRRFVAQANYGRPIRVEWAIEDHEDEDPAWKIPGYRTLIAAYLMKPNSVRKEAFIIVFPVFFRTGDAGQRMFLLHELGHLYTWMQEESFDEETEEYAVTYWARERAREMGVRIRKPRNSLVKEPI